MVVSGKQNLCALHAVYWQLGSCSMLAAATASVHRPQLHGATPQDSTYRCKQCAYVAAGVEELTHPLLVVLTAAAASSPDLRLAAFQHDAGMAAAVQLATAVPTPAFGASEAAAAAAVDVAAAANATAAVRMLVQIAEEKEIKAQLAHMVAEVRCTAVLLQQLLQGYLD